MWWTQLSAQAFSLWACQSPFASAHPPALLEVNGESWCSYCVKPLCDLAEQEDLWWYALRTTVHVAALQCIRKFGWYRRKFLGRWLEVVWSCFLLDQIHCTSSWPGFKIMVLVGSFMLVNGGTSRNGNVTHLYYQNKLSLILAYFSKMWAAVNRSMIPMCKTALLVYDGEHYRLRPRFFLSSALQPQWVLWLTLLCCLYLYCVFQICLWLQENIHLQKQDLKGKKDNLEEKDMVCYMRTY